MVLEVIGQLHDFAHLAVISCPFYTQTKTVLLICVDQLPIFLRVY